MTNIQTYQQIGFEFRINKFNAHCRMLIQMSSHFHFDAYSFAYQCVLCLTTTFTAHNIVYHGIQ